MKYYNYESIFFDKFIIIIICFSLSFTLSYGRTFDRVDNQTFGDT